jgi:hypothetical protein
MTMRAMGLAAACAVFVLVSILLAPPATARPIGNDLPWCGEVDGMTGCGFSSLAECEKWRLPGERPCGPNPRDDVID